MCRVGRDYEAQNGQNEEQESERERVGPYSRKKGSIQWQRATPYHPSVFQ